MKKMFFLSTMAIVISGSVLWGCIKNEIPELSGNDQVMLKSAAVTAENECPPAVYALVTQKNKQPGQMIVSNDENVLTIEFAGNEWPLNGVQLWVGSDPSMVPKNKQNIPVPGKFPFRDSGLTTFQIPLSGLISLPPGGSYDGKMVYIFALAEFAGSKGDGENPAWSEGVPFGTARWGSYSVYTVCARQKGCTPHTALGGDMFFNGNSYYDNALGGAQPIRTGDEKIAGTVEYDNNTLSFAFNQEWMFTDLLPAPSLIISGYADFSGSEDPVIVFTGEPTFYQELIYVGDIPFFNYYKIELKLQECY
jgi:hypothetical protein